MKSFILKYLKAKSLPLWILFRDININIRCTWNNLFREILGLVHYLIKSLKDTLDQIRNSNVCFANSGLFKFTHNILRRWFSLVTGLIKTLEYFGDRSFDIILGLDCGVWRSVFGEGKKKDTVFMKMIRFYWKYW